MLTKFSSLVTAVSLFAVANPVYCDVHREYDVTDNLDIQDTVHRIPYVTLSAVSLCECLADLDGDCDADLDDLTIFADWFVSGDLRADFTGDGVLNIDDLDAFLNAYHDCNNVAD